MTDHKAQFRLSPDFAEALAFAAALHTGQTRKAGNVPYISHLLAACSLVLEAGGTEDEAISALLHDALEDQGPDTGGAEKLAERIGRRFGPHVLAIVEACTDSTTFPKPPWRGRKEIFLHRLETAPESVCLVVVADKLHNARAILRDLRIKGPAAWAIFSVPQPDSQWYYTSLAEVLLRRLTGRGRFLALELDRTVKGFDHVGTAD